MTPPPRADGSARSKPSSPLCLRKKRKHRLPSSSRSADSSAADSSGGEDDDAGDSSGGERRHRRHKHRKHKHMPRRIKVEQEADEQSALSTGGVAAALTRCGTGSRSDTGSMSDDGDDDDIETLQAQAMTYLMSEASQPREHGEANKKRKHRR